MGREISWYVIPATIHHDTSKLLCFNLECEADKNTQTQFTDDWFYDDDKVNDWCPKCKLFAHGFNYTNPLIIDRIHIRHSYSNPIWGSYWNIWRHRIGSIGDFVNRFNGENMYRKVNSSDLRHVESELTKLGTPITDRDKEAFQETTDVIEFIKRYIYSVDYIVIMQDEL